MASPQPGVVVLGVENYGHPVMDRPRQIIGLRGDDRTGLDRFAIEETTIADVFSAAGYATGLVGKWHNGLHDMRYHPNNRGFQEFLGFLNGGMDYYNWSLDRNGSTERSDGRYLTDVLSREAVDFINRHAKEPFFLCLAYNAPHRPLQAPEKLIRSYAASGELTEEVATVYAMIETMDAGIGDVLGTLRKNGVEDDTIVVFTSDNGPVLDGVMQRYNGPFRGAKGDVLEGGIRVPCMVRWPGELPSGTESDHMVHFCDWLPTLAGMAGVPLPGSLELDGHHVACRLHGKADDIPDVRFWQRNRYEPVPRSNAAMREGPWKLQWPFRAGTDHKDPFDTPFYQHAARGAAHWLMDIDRTLPERDVGPAKPPQLFQIDNDPAETNNLADEYPDRVASMSSRWDDWFNAVSEEWRQSRNRIIERDIKGPQDAQE